MEKRIDAQNKRLNKLEKRVNNIVENRKIERTRSERRIWWGVGSPLLAAGVLTIINSEDSTARLLGASLIFVALYFMIVMGTALGVKFDLWVFGLISKLRRLFRKLGRPFRKIGRQLRFRKRT